jgi:hypothetical protein
MFPLEPKQLVIIAQELDSGMCCYLNTKSQELLFVPDTNHWSDIDPDLWKEELKKTKKDKKHFHCITPPSSRDSFKMMADFIETLDSSDLIAKLLIKALQRIQPFRGFKDVIDESNEHTERWFVFKQAQLIEWVKKEIAYSEDEEEE